MGSDSAGGVAVINPGEFAAYVFTIVAGIGAVGVIGAITRRIGRGGRPQRVLVSRDGVSVIPVPEGDTDPARGAAAERLAADLEALRDEVTSLRRELDEAQNRLDFTERLLGQVKERGLLNPPRER